MKRLLRLLAAISLISLIQLPIYAVAGDLRDGRKTYTTYCANCHGVTGTGEGPSAKWVSPQPRDFTACKLMAMYKDADLLKAIKDGGPAAFVSYNMPPFGEILTDEQIDDVLAYERSFCAKKQAAKNSFQHFLDADSTGSSHFPLSLRHADGGIALRGSLRNCSRRVKQEITIYPRIAVAASGNSGRAWTKWLREPGQGDDLGQPRITECLKLRSASCCSYY